MVGTFHHTIDAKGRMFVPARLRESLGDEFYVTICGESCLQIYSLEMWEAALAKLRTMPQEDQMELRPLFSNAAQCVPDGQGRIQLPQDLRDFVGLEKNVTIVGTGLYVQIWDSDTWKPTGEKEKGLDSVKAAIRKLNF
ncbi:MAG: division/cell wall cluster transcriptional repressor MraZ [Oscillospiraceae bacterium]|nr:division/cell wall cluster transcriptional repressor MraZ [Oscillospiraceae bacterium]